VEVDEPRDLFAGDRDARRQASLLELGVRCVRLQAEAVQADLEACLHQVAEAIRTIRDLS
jgi:very-short-patch-repair endonuclease